MEEKWNPRRVLGVYPGKCVGTTTKGGQCGQHMFSNSDLREASDLLDHMAVSDPRGARPHLRPLAEVTLCPKWHRKPGYSQVEEVRLKWWNTIVSYAELHPISSTIPSPVSLPRNTVRASRASEYISASRSLLTPPSPTPAPRRLQRNTPRSTISTESILASPHLIIPDTHPLPIPASRLIQERTTETIDSTERTSASLSLLTPPSSPPSPVLAPRLLREENTEVLDSNESNLETLSLLTPPTFIPSSTPAPRLLQSNDGQVTGDTVSTAYTLASFSTSTPPSSPPSPTPAPRLNRRNVRQPLDSNESFSTTPIFPELPSSPLRDSIPLLENASHVSDSTEPLLASLSVSVSSIRPTASIVQWQLEAPPVTTAIRSATLIADPVSTSPLHASVNSPVPSEALSNQSVVSTASSIMTEVPIVTPTQSPRQDPALDFREATNALSFTTIPNATVPSSQTILTAPTIPQRQTLNTWPQYTLERPMELSVMPYPPSSQHNLHGETQPPHIQEMKGREGSFSCLKTCGTSMLSDFSAFWQKVHMGQKAITAYLCCSPWHYELQDRYEV